MHTAPAEERRGCRHSGGDTAYAAGGLPAERHPDASPERRDGDGRPRARRSGHPLHFSERAGRRARIVRGYNAVHLQRPGCHRTDRGARPRPEAAAAARVCQERLHLSVLNDWKWRHYHMTFIHPHKRVAAVIHSAFAGATQGCVDAKRGNAAFVISKSRESYAHRTAPGFFGVV